MNDLSGRTAVVTGAASGIGQALACRLSSAGMSVVISDNDESGLDQTAARLDDSRVLAIPADVSDRQAIETLANEAFGRFGHVDLLCANAGIAGPWTGNIWDTPRREWDRVVGVNQYGVLNTLEAFLPRMIEAGREGHVVITASIVALLTGGIAVPYLVSKHGVLALAESLRLQLQALQVPVGVSVVCPDRVRTGILDRELAHQHNAATPPAEERAVVDALFSADDPDVRTPDEVADDIVAAVKDNRFLVLTHDISVPRILERLDAIREEVLAARPTPAGERKDRT
jgi:NAD(P)-dependent dehydrogenase (short-subunit alcohol dehydrogenase family)